MLIDWVDAHTWNIFESELQSAGRLRLVLPAGHSGQRAVRRS